MATLSKNQFNSARLSYELGVTGISFDKRNAQGLGPIIELAAVTDSEDCVWVERDEDGGTVDAIDMTAELLAWCKSKETF